MESINKPTKKFYSYKLKGNQELRDWMRSDQETWTDVVLSVVDFVMSGEVGDVSLAVGAQQRREKYDITFDNHITELGKIRDQGKKDGKNLAAAATTEIARGKAAGFYIDQKLIRHGKIEDMNLNELYDKMKTIKERNERILDAQQLLEQGNAKQKEEKQKEKSKEEKEKSEEEKETLDV